MKLKLLMIASILMLVGCGSKQAFNSQSGQTGNLNMAGQWELIGTDGSNPGFLTETTLTPAGTDLSSGQTMYPYQISGTTLTPSVDIPCPLANDLSVMVEGNNAKFTFSGNGAAPEASGSYSNGLISGGYVQPEPCPENAGSFTARSIESASGKTFSGNIDFVTGSAITSISFSETTATLVLTGGAEPGTYTLTYQQNGALSMLTGGPEPEGSNLNVFWTWQVTPENQQFIGGNVGDVAVFIGQAVPLCARCTGGALGYLHAQ